MNRSRASIPLKVGDVVRRSNAFGHTFLRYDVGVVIAVQAEKDTVTVTWGKIYTERLASYLLEQATE